MTHFLKAQLDNFSHDRFRSASSSMNCLYTYIDALDNTNYRSESDKLSTLSRVIGDKKIKMPASEKRVTSLDKEEYPHDPEELYSCQILQSLISYTFLINYLCNFVICFFSYAGSFKISLFVI